MMNRTHSTCGAAAGAWLAVVAQPSPSYALLGVGVGALAAYTPDLDHPSARPVKKLGLIGWAVCRILRFVSLATTRQAHRGLTHSLLFALILGGATFLLAGVWLPISLSLYLAAAVATGVVAALLGDLVTNSGLKHVLWPLTTQVSIPRSIRICTGGITEKFVVFPVMVAETGIGLAQVTLGGHWWILGLTFGGLAWVVVALVLSSTWSWRSPSSSRSRGRPHRGSGRRDLAADAAVRPEEPACLIRP